MTKQKESTEQVAYESQGQAGKINWLKGWEAIEFKADPNDPKKIEEEKDRIRWYVRGYLEEYTERHEDYAFDRFEKFEFTKESESPLKFRVNVFLIPSAREPEHSEGNGSHAKNRNPRGGTNPGRGPLGGVHLVPPPPPDPGGR